MGQEWITGKGAAAPGSPNDRLLSVEEARFPKHKSVKVRGLATLSLGGFSS